MSTGIRLRLEIRGPTDRIEFLGTARDKPLGEALRDSPCRPLDPVPGTWADLPIGDFDFEFVLAAPPPEGTPLAGPRTREHPETLTEEQATRLAYGAEVADAASLLRAGQSVLVVCDKIVVPYLAEHVVLQAGREPRLLEAGGPEDTDGDASPGALGMGGGAQQSLRQRLLNQLRGILRELKDGQVLVVPHLDLLGGGQDAALPNEARELIELLYSAGDVVLLGFVDPSLPLPEVLAARFSTRLALEGTPRQVPIPGTGEHQPIQKALITRDEAAHFAGLDDTDMYKFLAGLNPVRLRHALRYALQRYEGRVDATVNDLRDTIRTFKAQQSSNFEIPDVQWEDIGGYEEVKEALARTLDTMDRSRTLPQEDEHLRGELTPRGFIFHGEPGTGKTLFAKAIANKFNATIQIVSGPEVTNKYVGEGERRIRELFAEGRRNAPSVIVFDEIDSIAARRTGGDDGGSRAGNAMVAQILTEMDGFRPDVQLLVVGTTNRLSLIDPALLRPARFVGFHIGLPDAQARRGIIQVHARRYRVSVDGVLEALTHATDGWNGDQIRALFRDAYVGEKFDDRPADAYQLGELVGQHLTARRQRLAAERREA
ncbi:ATP-binding protein [Amycolatopsis balhimycina DSM 5908]|uniref:ATP-binding protein n=1 Tax=Amycolatopsis balhimycina DSM 5908 TaxID=1081091 RepID=A0A428WI09_AMYBA|nr:ATP-binding protein [Amycolatopsis balhimycina]RSM42724.1 ATP-binding protein [Amycolatopsis balhimycina DSM 5908]